MPDLQDKMPVTPSAAELNPLTNPLLEKNLGRWAKVYFSSPPSKRDQAVSNLLEEIRRESGINSAAATGRPYFARTTNFANMVCGACQRQNPPGNKFCSRCGQTLSPQQSVSTESPVAPPQAPPLSANDVQWLRGRALNEQVFSGLDGPDIPHSRGWKYLAAAAVIVLGGFIYLQWAPSARTTTAPTTAMSQANATGAVLPSENSSPAETRPPEAIPAQPKAENHSVASVPDTPARPAVPEPIQKASEKSPLLDARTSRPGGAAQENGVSDLRLAQRYLGGSMGVRDSTEAAKLLWKAVGKQNTTAAILLSDLYQRGDGVPRSCDQARLLVTAAAKRGDHQAAQQLQRLQSQGCR